MGCSIKPQYKKISTAITPNSQILVQPGNFVVENVHSFQDIYRLGKLLGTGTFGEVRSCVHRTSLAKRAVKIIRKDLLTSAHHRACLDNEIKILKSLDHPNIIRVFEFFEEVKRLYIVMEYCKGGELFAEIVKRGTLTEKSAAAIMKQIFVTLEYLQRVAVVHRDLKPENILLEEMHDVMNIKIIDFGTAVVLKETTALMKGNAGTIYYMSPEVLTGNYNYLCDMWSAGIIMYIILAGFPPFDGKTHPEIIEAIKLGEFNISIEPWTSISESGKQLLKQLMCTEDTRLSPGAALNSNWIAEHSDNEVHNSRLSQVLVNLKDFRATSVLRDAIKTYITTQYIAASDVKDLKEVFVNIDKDHDGKISYEELMAEYSKIMEEEEAEEIVKSVMKEVDSDRNGFIDYSEFLRANVDNRKLMSEENLNAAFRLFDQDGNGKISADEMKRILQGDSSIEVSVWNRIIQEFDSNGDGEIDMEEFAVLLKSFSAH